MHDFGWKPMGSQSINDLGFRRTSSEGLGTRFASTRIRYPGTCSKIATWNVEGLNVESGTKLDELTRWMLGDGVGVLCMQETHEHRSGYFLHNGFLVILSGEETTTRTYTGVGFIIAPALRHAVVSFLQFSDRLASLRIRITGGQLCLITAYAPTNMKDYEYRQAFVLAGIRVH